MKNLENYGVVALENNELNETNGGFYQFVFGAIVGGLIFEAWKAGLEGYYEACGEGVYEGIPGGR